MLFDFLVSAINRHFDETRLLINQLTDHDPNLLSEPVLSGRSLGEIVLHMIRSIEFYSRGVAKNHWEPLSYNTTKYRTAQEMKLLYEDVIAKSKSNLEKMSPSMLDDVLEDFNRPASKGEILLELLEHSVQHRGQMLVYLRLLGIEPVKIPYII